MKIIESILNLIYPPVCGFCNEINMNFICDKCKRKIDEIKISNIEDYSNIPVYFNEHYYLLKYENEVRDFILQYKFHEKSYLYKSFAKLITCDEVFRKFIYKYDFIISVPIHKWRFKERGYNQSGLIAKEIAKLYQKPYYDDILIKNKNVISQSTLDVLGRISNIKNAFSVGKNSEMIKEKKIALFDDIFTTGSTVSECARVLKEHGAHSVGVFTLAKD